MKRLMLILAFLLLAVPLAALAQSTYQYQKGGIFDCNGYGNSSIGKTSASGIYVPVSDATVELNTGILVYEQCLLRPIVDKERQAAMAYLLQQQYKAIQTGRNGSPMYVVNQNTEDLNNVSDAELGALIKNGFFSTLNSLFQSAVEHAVVVTYETSTRSANGALNCSYSGDLSAAMSGSPTGSVWSAIMAGGDPACNPIQVYYTAKALADTRIGLTLNYNQDQLNAGQYFYPRTDNATDPLLRQVVTPAAVVNTSFETVLQSPVHQLENANNIGQILDQTYSYVTTQLVSDVNGLAGLGTGLNSGSYLGQIIQNTQTGVTNATSNLIIQELNADIQNEQQYANILNNIVNTYKNAIASVQGYETQCWGLVTNAVCASSPSNGKCKDASGNTLTVATSTAFSQAANGADFAAREQAASSTAANANKLLQTLTSLVNAINTSAPNAIQTAGQAIDKMTKTNTLPTQTDVQNAQTTLTDAQQYTSNTLQQIQQNWTGQGTDQNGNPLNTPWNSSTYPTGSSVNPGIGWCNATNSQTIAAWDAQWQH